MGTVISRRNGGNLVDHIHPVGDLSEDGISEVVAAVVKEGIVGQVDEEL